MKTDFSVGGTGKAEFLTCTKPCGRGCRDRRCPNETREIKLLNAVRFFLPGGNVLETLPGFVFDGASIPKLCWTTVGHPLEHRFLYAALLHDAMYSAQYLSRTAADKLFYSFLRDFAGVGFAAACKIFAAVRLFGGIAWRSKTKEQIESARRLVHLEEPEK